MGTGKHWLLSVGVMGGEAKGGTRRPEVGLWELWVGAWHQEAGAASAWLSGSPALCDYPCSHLSLSGKSGEIK